MTLNKKLLSLPPPGKIRHSPNIQISRSCSGRQSLNSTRECRYCNNSEFEFPRELISLCLALKLLFKDLLL